ncbi:hypothetical protein [Actinomadura sp. HBU206391]|uniref:hypothetical protein n=1 Tax=Actinomadura sp. HBU206391 TaxID=2731692 RepID=UPI00164FC8D9|nr:hypothetical protein [Actinomadura sp. HBU206391]MBC6459890.1 hypothetical protein [Actinomadura sp. HBU206391]
MTPEDLTEPEQALWKAFPRGEDVDLRVGDPESGDPSRDAQWGPDREVRAEVITALLTGAVPPEPGHVPALRLSGARVTGRLRLAHAEIVWPVRLRSCVFSTPIDLDGARTRQFDLTGSRLAGLEAALASIDGDLELAECHCTGRIRLTGAHIAGALRIQRARLHEPGRTAVLANRLTVDDDLLCQEIVVSGEFQLAGAQIGGMVGLDGARLDNPGGRALNAFSLSVGAHLWARRGFTATGEMSLGDASVGRELDLSGAHLRNPGANALLGNGLSVGTVLFLGQGFQAEGAVRLRRAQIGGPLHLRHGRLSNPGGDALDCRQVQARELVMQTAAPIDGMVDLRHARFEVVRDDPATWPAQLRLDGLGYDALDPRLTADQRLAWLRRSPEAYLPQVYEQLAGTYRRLGDETDARTVLLAKQRRRWQSLTWYARIWGRLQDLTVGYGYRPLRAGGWLVALTILGTVTFGVDHPPAVRGGDPPAFNPLVYTLDLLLPIIDFGQERSYQPQHRQRWLAYALIAVGWLLATTIAAGVTRALRRE